MEIPHLKPRQWLWAFVCFWLACSWLAAAQDNAPVAEYQVKAAYLYNFTKFTAWPANAFASTNAPIIIGIVGEDPFGSALDDAIKGEVVRDHPLIVRRLRASDNLRSCHVLFICRSEKERMSLLLQGLKGSPVLTVSDASDFAERGGMVRFVLVDETVKLEINQAAAEQASLQISSKLLKLAHIVKSD